MARSQQLASGNCSKATDANDAFASAERPYLDLSIRDISPASGAELDVIKGLQNGHGESFHPDTAPPETQVYSHRRSHAGGSFSIAQTLLALPELPVTAVREELRRPHK